MIIQGFPGVSFRDIKTGKDMACLYSANWKIVSFGEIYEGLQPDFKKGGAFYV